VGRDDPELDLGVDVLGQVDLDGVESQVLERSLDTNRLGLDRETLGFERGGDLVGVDRAVEVRSSLALASMVRDRWAI